MHVAWLCRFLPATYQEHVPVLIEGDFEKEKANSAWKKKSYRLNLVCSLFRLDLNSVAVYLCLSEAAWLVAWDRYAMVAHGLGQLAYKDSQLHKANVCEKVRRLQMTRATQGQMDRHRIKNLEG